MRALPLQAKVQMTINRIRAFYNEKDCYLSFSGGKDSTVLLHIIRTRLPTYDIPAVFNNVSTQYRELKDFVRWYEPTAVILYPEKNFVDVCRDEGFPLVSKEVSGVVSAAKKHMQNNLHVTLAELESNPEKWAEILRSGEIKGANVAVAQMMGWVTKDNVIATGLCRDNRSYYTHTKYKWLLEAPFDLSPRCCDIMKKAPLDKYTKETGRYPITGELAEESNFRLVNWMSHGCNMFGNKPKSAPLSFWTEQDILEYLYINDVPIAKCYGKIIKDEDGKYKTTLCDRTGCITCGFGCYQKGDMHYLRLKEDFPEIYNLLDVCKNNGYTMREAIKWMNKHHPYGKQIEGV